MKVHIRFFLFFEVVSICGVTLLKGAPARATCLAVPGDINNDGVANVSDVQCMILMNLWSLAGQIDDAPSCYSGGNAPNVAADFNCDFVVNITDTLLAIGYALKQPPPQEINADGDLCPDACNADWDQDGTADMADCAPFDGSIHSNAVEVCNGYDDDCDGLNDPLSQSTVQESCNDGNVCNGTEFCVGLQPWQGVRISEVMTSPAANAPVQWIELHNGGAQPVNITGWALSNESGNKHVIQPGGALFVPAHGFVVLASGTLPCGMPTHYKYDNFEMGALGGAVALINKEDQVQDSLEYDIDLFPFLEAGGSSIARRDVAAGSDASNNWAQSTHLMCDDGYGSGTPLGPNRDVMDGLCLESVPLICDDGNSQTNDSCDPQTGCTFVLGDPECYQWSETSVVNATTEGAQWAPEIAALPPNHWVIVWRTTPEAPRKCTDKPVSNESTCDEVMMRIVDETGQPITTEDIAVNQTTFDFQTMPRVAVSDNGIIAVIWLSKTQSGATVMVRMFSQDGTPETDEIPVAENVWLTNRYHDIFAVPGGKFGLIYRIDPPGSKELRVRFIESSGTWEGTASPVIPNPLSNAAYTYTSHFLSEFSAHAINESGFVLSWNAVLKCNPGCCGAGTPQCCSDCGADCNTSGTSIWMTQLFTTTAPIQPLSGPNATFSCNASTGSFCEYTEVAQLTNPSVALVGQCQIPPHGFVKSTTPGTGELVDVAEFVANETQSFIAMEAPDVTELPSGGFMVVWRNGGLQIAGLGYDSVGQATTPLINIESFSVYTDGEPNHPGVAALPSGCVGVVWYTAKIKDVQTSSYDYDKHDIKLRIACPIPCP